MPVTRHDVVIDHAGGLRERIGNHRAAEFEARAASGLFARASLIGVLAGTSFIDLWRLICGRPSNMLSR